MGLDLLDPSYLSCPTRGSIAHGRDVSSAMNVGNAGPVNVNLLMMQIEVPVLFQRTDRGRRRDNLVLDAARWDGDMDMFVTEGIVRRMFLARS